MFKLIINVGQIHQSSFLTKMTARDLFWILVFCFIQSVLSDCDTNYNGTIAFTVIISIAGVGVLILAVWVIWYSLWGLGKKSQQKPKRMTPVKMSQKGMFNV